MFQFLEKTGWLYTIPARILTTQCLAGRLCPWGCESSIMFTFCRSTVFLLYPSCCYSASNIVFACHIFVVCFRIFFFFFFTRHLGYLILTAQFSIVRFPLSTVHLSVYRCGNVSHWNEWSHPVMASGLNWPAGSSQCHNLIMIFKCHDL